MTGTRTGATLGSSGPFPSLPQLPAIPCSSCHKPYVTDEAKLIFNSFVKHEWLLLSGHGFKEYDYLAAGKGNATCCRRQHDGGCFEKHTYLL